MLLIVAIFALLVALVTSSVRLNRWIRLGHAVLYIIGLIVTHQATLRVSKLTIDAMIQEPEMLSTLAIIVSIELLLTIAVVTYQPACHSLRDIYRREGLVVAVMSACHQIALWIPSLLLLPALCYLRSYTIYGMPGVNYWAVTIAFAVVLLILIELVPRIIRDREFLRIIAMLMAGVLAIGSVLAYILVPEHRVQSPVELESSSWSDLWILLGTVLLGVLLGYITPRVSKLSRHYSSL